ADAALPGARREPAPDRRRGRGRGGHRGRRRGREGAWHLRNSAPPRGFVSGRDRDRDTLSSADVLPPPAEPARRRPHGPGRRAGHAQHAPPGLSAAALPPPHAPAPPPPPRGRPPPE